MKKKKVGNREEGGEGSNLVMQEVGDGLCWRGFTKSREDGAAMTTSKIALLQTLSKGRFLNCIQFNRIFGRKRLASSFFLLSFLAKILVRSRPCIIMTPPSLLPLPLRCFSNFRPFLAGLRRKF